MRKLATGLLSMQASNVPGSENVEVSEFKEEDAESANKSGFNTMEVDGFENLDHSGEAVLASNKFFNYRIGYEMKKELIKLNHALNGIGYKDLVKVADEGVDLDADSDENPPTARSYDNITSTAEKTYTPTISSSEFKVDKTYTRIATDGRPDIVFKVINLNPIKITINRGNPYFDAYVTYVMPDSNHEKRYIEGDLIHQEKMKEVHANRPVSDQPAASTSPVVGSTVVLAVGESYKDNVKENPYYYKVIGPNSFEVSGGPKKLNRKVIDNTYTGFTNFTSSLRNGIKGGTIVPFYGTIPTFAKAKVITPTAAGEAATPAAATTPATTAATTPAATPAAATTPAATPAAATGGLVSETVNGQPAVSIGTFGKDQIFLTIDSVKSGKPQFYIKDGASGNAAPIGRGDGRVRSKLGPLEVARLADRLVGAGVSPGRAEAFKRFMNLDRRQNRLPFGRKRREERLSESQEAMKSVSARKDRLDKLEKKGVI